MDPVFRFKQFSVRHDNCIMKVGTDGVLLGAYARVADAERILDIGTGSGVIALMLAQRSNALVEGVEIDEPSARQAQDNAAASPWKNRIIITHASFQQYCPRHAGEFDAVICNPPFFPNHLRSEDEKRNLVRHAMSLNFEELVDGVITILKPSGTWWLILPCSETGKFLDIAGNKGFSLHHELSIFPKVGKKPHRNIISLGWTHAAATSDTLIIRAADDNYTEEYKELTREFYLSF